MTTWFDLACAITREHFHAGEPEHSVAECDDEECELCRQFYLEQDLDWFLHRDE